MTARRCTPTAPRWSSAELLDTRLPWAEFHARHPTRSRTAYRVRRWLIRQGRAPIPEDPANDLPVTEASLAALWRAIRASQPADTASLTAGTTTLVWDVQLKEADGTVSTIDSGALTVSADITRATS